MGNNYIYNSGDIPEEISIKEGESDTVSIKQGISEFPLGNKFESGTRTNGNVPKWFETSSSNLFKLKPEGESSVGVHDIELETFDKNSSLQSTLRTDKIKVNVLARAPNEDMNGKIDEVQASVEEDEELTQEIEDGTYKPTHFEYTMTEEIKPFVEVKTSTDDDGIESVQIKYTFNEQTYESLVGRISVITLIFKDNPKQLSS